MLFYIPHLQGDPGAAELEWQRHLRDSPAPADSRRVYRMTYLHEGSKYVVTVGRPRSEYRRKTGPRGGYIKDAGKVSSPTESGTIVSGIIDADRVLFVWSYGPPFGGWANPSMVGHDEVSDIEYFEGYGPPARSRS